MEDPVCPPCGARPSAQSERFETGCASVKGIEKLLVGARLVVEDEILQGCHSDLPYEAVGRNGEGAEAREVGVAPDPQLVGIDDEQFAEKCPLDLWNEKTLEIAHAQAMHANELHKLRDVQELCREMGDSREVMFEKNGVVVLLEVPGEPGKPREIDP